MIGVSAVRTGIGARSAATATFCGLAALAWHAAIAAPVDDLPGRWAGPGNITMSSGESEQMRCVATYFVEGGGSNVKQNLRCASQGYKIDAVANFLVANGQVTGNWEERTWSNTGSIKGQVSQDGFKLTIDGSGFTAAMAVATSACKQSISITPRGYEIAKISMNLTKC